ncbi:triose-phosphate isomerase [Candidatus Atelocyanobacterium thalassae]|uniref:Triosephosphate isomerase n=1 Tax=cyanobacterium endosymbiont of Braarudosphaera bigelowii TaxID=1285375 RepID=A0ABN6JZR8_9CHRO|nr:triose-phosphate isomerase [Candidatus Atelocyanobacterium thalassa]BDA39958.1 triosephosphate isomerase [cyanobacterium endosymbiont of Braarudosphaera bigelowii]
MRKKIVAGNWKMHKTQAEALEFFSALKFNKINGTEIVLCVPFTLLSLLSKNLHGEDICLGAQNIHWAEKGAYTGEISGLMLVESNVSYVIVGHSERRQYFGETDKTVNSRVIAAQYHGIKPILCIGETKQQRDAGKAEEVIINQLKQGLINVDQENLVIAYEPIWAIGTGETCDVSEANRITGIIREQVLNKNISIQYGGSVTPKNIGAIMSQPNIDGVLVGGASLNHVSFSEIINYQ